MEPLASFRNKRYLNIETFRKSGKGVRTPVWFAEDGEELIVYSRADAGKVKRIRNDPRVRIVPCDFRGNPEGTWIDAEARILSAGEAARGQSLLTRKYGWMKKFGDIFSKIAKRKQTVMALRAGGLKTRASHPH